MPAEPQPLNAEEARVLKDIRYGEAIFGSLIAGGGVSTADLRRLVNSGLAFCIRAQVVDDDCFPIEPERFANGYKLTDAGALALKHYEEEHDGK